MVKANTLSIGISLQLVSNNFYLKENFNPEITYNHAAVKILKELYCVNKSS